jgi:hypothetical protein
MRARGRAAICLSAPICHHVRANATPPITHSGTVRTAKTTTEKAVAAGTLTPNSVNARIVET